jgi:hypothetical protein
MQFGLAEAWWSRVRNQPVESEARLDAATNLAASLCHNGRYAEAEQMQLELLAVQQRVLGAEHPYTVGAANNLALCLSRQGKYAEAELMQREVLSMQRRTLGAEHPHTLGTTTNLAGSLSRQGKNAEAEWIGRELLEVQRRVLGAEHPSTLGTAGNLASFLSQQGKHTEAEKMERELLEVLRRVLGVQHPSTLRTTGNLAGSLSRQGKNVEAEQILRELLDAHVVVFRAEHPYVGSYEQSRFRPLRAREVCRSRVDVSLCARRAETGVGSRASGYAEKYTLRPHQLHGERGFLSSRSSEFRGLIDKFRFGDGPVAGLVGSEDDGNQLVMTLHHFVVLVVRPVLLTLTPRRGPGPGRALRIRCAT